MTSPSLPFLQDAFVDNLGQPVPFGDEKIVQGDDWLLDGAAVIEIRFADRDRFRHQWVRLSIKKPGKILLSTSKPVRVLAIYDDPALPRVVRHRIDPKGVGLMVFNGYQVRRGGQTFEESWTGNAGMIVTRLSDTSRRYECSDGNGAFDRTALVFDMTVLPADTPWHPNEIDA